jgi:hypothetical protein
MAMTAQEIADHRANVIGDIHFAVCKMIKERCNISPTVYEQISKMLSRYLYSLFAEDTFEEFPPGYDQIPGEWDCCALTYETYTKMIQKEANNVFEDEVPYWMRDTPVEIVVPISPKENVTLLEMERQHIRNVYEQCNKDRKRTAAILEVSESKVYAWEKGVGKWAKE